MRIKIITIMCALSLWSCTKPTKTILQIGTERGIDESKVQISHTDEFRRTNAHGHEYFKNRALCAECHGHSFEGGKAEVSCKDCHDYPHPHKWALPENHGKAYLESIPPSGEDEGNPSLCLKCHGRNSHLKEVNPEEFVSCSTCHAPIPHTWSLHGKYARRYLGKCTICHKDQKRLMPNYEGNGCYGCHKPGTTPTMQFPLDE
ncbi:MAG: hypothetical protein HYW47_06665 [Deltaproteobacteria bacterium]|nr:hypothetical protein [Deltaproteobacteria bacterium]